MNSAINVEGMSKVYGKSEKPAVDDVNFSIPKGEIFGLLGPNGAGKTTLVLMLTTLTRPTKGNGYVCGHNILTELKEVRASLGYCPQKSTLDNELTAWENMLLYAQLSGLSKKESESRVTQILKETSLFEKKNTLIRNFSGGMKRRLELMGALINNPKVIFLDEPTLGLDPDFRREIWQRIRKAKENGATIFMTTHYMEEADELCDRVGFINSGRIKAIGNPKDMKAKFGEIIHLQLQDDKQKDIVKVLLQQLNQNAEVITATDGLHIFTSAGVDLSDSLKSKLIAKDIKIRSIEYSSASLEDMFLYYTGQNIFEEII